MPMRSRGKLLNWAFWKPVADPAAEETKLTVARRKIFARIQELETLARWKTDAGRALRSSAGKKTGISRSFLLWRAHRLEDAGRAHLRAVVQLRKDAKKAGLDAVGHRVGRRDAFRNAGGGRD